MSDFNTGANNNLAGQQSGGMGGNNTNTTGGGGGDAIDKAVDFLEKKAGHEQSHSTTEKISDGLRKGFSKLTGKEPPVADKTYN